MTCWFSGFVALPVFLNERVCFGGVCKMAYASIVFAVFQWILFAATMAYTAFFTLRKRHTTPVIQTQKDLETDIESVQVVIEAKS
jgi:hypothetical protein